MAKRSVEAVWGFPPTVSNYRAMYGRIKDGPTRRQYTKDYLQVGGEAGRLLSEMYELGSGHQSSANVTYAWPGGEVPGRISFSADRFHISWDYNDPPEPLALAAPGAGQPLRILPGVSREDLLDQGRREPDEDVSDAEQRLADEQWSRLRADGFNPWIVLVRLFDDPSRLHMRLYLGEPPAGYEFADTEQLPDVILKALHGALPKTGYSQPERAGTSFGLQFEKSGEARLQGQLAREVWAALQDNRNVLLSGPPGTGKTVALEEVAKNFIADPVAVSFDPDMQHNAWGGVEQKTLATKSRGVVFHPSYGYENFVLGVLPEPTDSGVGVRVRPGPLLTLAHFASQPKHRALLTVDEFNRGNAAGIFGDTLALLDTDKRSDVAVPESGAVIDRSYPGLEVHIPSEFTAVDEPELMKQTLRLPDQLFILAAMNSSDRSVAPLDAAMRRRFSILFVAPDYAVLAEHLRATEAVDDGGTPVPAWSKKFEEWEARDVSALAVEVLRKINERIEFVSGRDFSLGQAQFWHVVGDDRDSTLQSLCEAFDRNVIGTLRMSYIDHDEALAAVLGLPPGEDARNGVAHWVPVPESLRELANARLVVSTLSTKSPKQQAKALRALCS